MSRIQINVADRVSTADLLRLLGNTCQATLASNLIQIKTGTLAVANPRAAVRPVAATRRQTAAFATELATLTDESAIRTATARVLAESSLMVEPVRVAVQTGAFAQATGVEQTRAAAKALVVAAERAHTDLLMSAASCAVQRAAVATGFATLEVRQPRVGVLRVLAVNDQGAGVTTELRADAKGHLTVESEVVGVAEPRCDATLQAFNAALDAEGLRLRHGSTRATRGKATGEAARDCVANPPGQRKAPTGFAPARQARPRPRLRV